MSGYTKRERTPFAQALGQLSLLPAAAAPPPRRKRKPPVPPLRNCPACGRKFRSWNDTRYCTRRDCTDARDSGITLSGSLRHALPEYDPATAPWPEGF